MASFVPKCDCADESGALIGCIDPVAFQCRCRRCEAEPADEGFYSCEQHVREVQLRHERIRGRAAELCRIRPICAVRPLNDEQAEGRTLRGVAKRVLRKVVPHPAPKEPANGPKCPECGESTVRSRIPHPPKPGPGGSFTVCAVIHWGWRCSYCGSLFEEVPDETE